MGRLLKEALKFLCGENRWSYAVFWKIGHRNPALLVWEEYHCETASNSTLPAISGIETTEILLQEWEGLWNSSESRFPKFGYQTEDKVMLLINKMMINNQVQVVGEGIVGRAAFMGFHQWILQETCMMEGFPSEVLAEVNHQFLAGMQTVAVIPVLPHGVVQLGSTIEVVENMVFVHDVKCLFAQLGGVPGTLLSDTYASKDTGPKFGSSTLNGEPISAVISRHPSFEEARFTPITNVGFNQQNIAFHASGMGSQPSVAQIQDNHQMQSNPCLTPTMSKPLTDLFQIKNLPIIQPNLPLGGQLEARETGVHVILSSSDARLNQQASPNHPGFRSNNRFSASNSSCSSVTGVGKQIVSGVGLREHASDILPASVNSSGSPIRSKGGTVPNSVQDSPLISLLGGRFESNPPYPPLDGLQCDLSPSATCWSNNYDVLHSLPLQSHSSTDHNHNQTNWTAGKQVIENDVLQSLSILSSHPDEEISRGRSMPGFLSDSWMSSSEHNKKRSTSCNIICEDAYVKPPSGDDLFDALSIDLKNGKQCGRPNTSLIHGADSNNKSASLYISKCSTPMDEGPGYNDVNDGISESGIFSETPSDHLLDAVVSKVHSSPKQMIDDDISCWTTLTKISSSSVATVSQSCGQVSVSDHKQGKFGGLPPTLVKALKVGSTSSKSVCTKDNAEATSQISSMYGSQVSLAAEDSQNMKRDNSISTAHSKRPLDAGKANRKRLKPGDSSKPRPKDRQMIQDRVKELREIVPNGAKCSIDALLERTIKHMLFLQSVTKHAGKLKQTGESKIINEDGGLFLKDNFEGGATWAYEVGSQSMVCPIIVEDLNIPGQMLVEMLCEERGLFLEIADILRGLGLTILKGVMEAHDDKVWVHFTLEANRDVTRMQIFMALVNLLEQAGKSSTSSSKGIATGNMLAHGTPLQASIPATGQSDN